VSDLVAATRFERRPARAVRVLLGLALAAHCVAAHADDADKQEMRGLDEQVQEVKSDVLGIANELDRLEERLLYPSGTQVAVFVALAETESEPFRLDSLQVQIDGEPVARHVYAFNELQALKKGGVQRIYTGNVSTGEHRIDVVVAGKLPSGKDFTETQSFSFTKGVPPKLVEITLGGEAGPTAIRLGSL
jgi:archaellum component FlaG (FlaF/FlaG flagellin family)